ncbi:MAG TPA: nucleoside deaminase [Prolixibacteraceae bacterium]|nr:nucleoside deaminase [Prolixibacteraceae bacterium]HOR99615.1 nucleoside deaminase [Prolixibacteraceae bacterium]HOS89032.1 nucleoside deaminase [Prolixibacteraceae bacterium]HPL44340.1 nucleoside deaminase [Prolixibacteraceae bacterium]HQE50803.1 nucleoside deaminase [Prolixibacteraceae bacterium]
MEEEKDIRLRFMKRAAQLAHYAAENGYGGPFGAVVVKDGEIIGEGFNRVTSSNDPTAHAEIEAIRSACNTLKSFQLSGCEIYSSCEPCPMCMGAIYWARPVRLYYGASRYDAAQAGFDDEFIYRELGLPDHLRKIQVIHLPSTDSADAFEYWKLLENKTKY